MSALNLACVAVFLPVCVAGILWVIPALRTRGRIGAFLSVLAALASTASALILFGMQRAAPNTVILDAQARWLTREGRSMADVGFYLDGVSTSMLVVVCVVALLVQIFSLGYMADEPPAAFGRYFTYHSLFLFSMAGLVVAPNLLQLFMCWELVGLASYLLIGFYFKKPSAARAAVKAFWVTKFADMGLLLGIIILYAQTGSFSWGPEAVATLTASGAATAVGLLLFLAIMGKSAQFPLHLWLPDAMEGPTPVSALLHAATMVAAGVYLGVRAMPVFAASDQTLWVMAHIGGFTALFAACVAVVQTDIKKVLAYSTCSQLGYMVAALGTGEIVGAYFHLTTHAYFKALLFLAAGSVIHGVHSNQLQDMGGLFGKMKITAITFIIGALALAGFPGTAGFFSKDLILEQLLHAELFFPYACGMTAAFLTAFYMGRVVFLAFFGPPSEAAQEAHESGFPMTIPLVLLAALSLGIGFFGTQLAGLYGAEYHFHLSPTGIVASALGFLGIGLAWMAFGRRPGMNLSAFQPIGNIIRYGATDRIFKAVYERIILGASAVLSWIDRYLIDGLMNWSAYITVVGGRELRGSQTGRIMDYVYFLVFGLLVLSASGWIGQ